MRKKIRSNKSGVGGIGYTIGKIGTATGPDNRDLDTIPQGLHGFAPVSEEYEDPAPEAEETPVFAAEYGAQAGDAHSSEASAHLIIEIPLAGFTPGKLDNLAALISKLCAATKAKRRILAREKYAGNFRQI